MRNVRRPLPAQWAAPIGWALALLLLPPAPAVHARSAATPGAAPGTTAAQDTEQAYEKALEGNPSASKRAVALTGMAEARLAEGRYAEAIAAATQAIEAAPGSDADAQARSMICRARAMGRLSPREAPMPPLPGAQTIPLVVDAADSPHETAAPLRLSRLSGNVTRPRKVYAPPPAYTEAARKARLQGMVILETVVDQDGCVADARVLKGLSMGLNDMALAAAETWVFAPATLDGKPIKVLWNLTMDFRIYSSQPPAIQAAPPRPHP